MISASFGLCAQGRFAAIDRIAEMTILALRLELAVEPKPGLVTLTSDGSHSDMNAPIFLRSIDALRCYFREIAEAGFDLAPFEDLRQLGVAAERRMMTATGGVNTHRGAIFALGLLSAAAGRLTRYGVPLSPAAIAAFVGTCWGSEILAAGMTAPPSHGIEVARTYGNNGARVQAASGFPAVSFVALPAFRAGIAETRCWNAASVQTLFALMAELDDTNLLHRGGRDGAAFAKASASAFLLAGGVGRPGWRGRAAAISECFAARRLSPGGCADLLAATLFLAQIEKGAEYFGTRSVVSWAG